MEEKNTIIKELVPMFAKARAEGLWFYCKYQDIWFSPSELKAENDKGRFILGSVNWTLRDPIERLKQLNNLIISTEAEKKRFEGRMHGFN